MFKCIDTFEQNGLEKRLMTISELMVKLEEIDQRLREKYQLEKDGEFVLLRLAKLMEEVGELADAVLAVRHLQRESKEYGEDKVKELGKEVADVVSAALLLGVAAGVEVEESVLKKLREIEERGL